jgi:rhodanese-related sulfurtransferase
MSPVASEADISYQEIRRGLKDRTLAVLNVLSAEAFRQGHIPGSISLPLEELTARAGAVLPDRSAALAVYCGSPT